MSTVLTPGINRWALQDGALAVAAPEGATIATLSGTMPDGTTFADVFGDNPPLTVFADDDWEIDRVSMAAIAAHGLGAYEIDWAFNPGGAVVHTTAELVSQRYCTRDDLIEYGRLSNDGFEDESRYPRAAVAAAIQAAEEAIDAACGRSFCQRAVTVRLRAGRLCELPVVDATAISEGELVTDRQAVCGEDADAVVTYGLRPDAQVRRAAVKLAAWYLRPRAAAENARGQSVDGVFVGFELATGEEGSWTGIPEVDAFIEQRRSRRAVVM